jgi:hypothetical protein
MERVKRGKYGHCTLYVFENRTMKPAEIVLRKGGGRIRANDRGGESDQVTL